MRKPRPCPTTISRRSALALRVPRPSVTKRTTAPQKAREALRKAIPGFAELHGQGIGCPDCPPESNEADPDFCPAYRQMELALAALDALREGR